LRYQIDLFASISSVRFTDCAKIRISGVLQRLLDRNAQSWWKWLDQTFWMHVGDKWLMFSDWLSCVLLVWPIPTLQHDCVMTEPIVFMIHPCTQDILLLLLYSCLHGIYLLDDALRPLLP
jgi:hypothetical protein